MGWPALITSSPVEKNETFNFLNTFTLLIPIDAINPISAGLK